MSRRYITTRVETESGVEMKCSYFLDCWSGTYFEPPECDASEPEFEIDGEVVDYSQMSDGEKALADKLYEAGVGECNYEEEYCYGPDY